MTELREFLVYMKLEEEGYRVWTLDERDNVQELGILNPADPERKLSFMADVPHALKNVRNLMLQSGYKLPSVIIVERGKIVEVYHHGKNLPRVLSLVLPADKADVEEVRQRVIAAKGLHDQIMGSSLVQGLFKS